jgi:hypothetical protein
MDFAGNGSDDDRRDRGGERDKERRRGAKQGSIPVRIRQVETELVISLPSEEEEGQGQRTCSTSSRGSRWWPAGGRDQ